MKNQKMDPVIYILRRIDRVRREENDRIREKQIHEISGMMEFGYETKQISMKERRMLAEKLTDAKYA